MNSCSYVGGDYMNNNDNINNNIDTVNNENDICSATIIHESLIKPIENSLINDTTANDLSEFFKVFGDPSRLKILNALSKEEICVCDLSCLLKMTQSAISHQLRILKQAKLVKFRREGKAVFYSLADDHVKNIFEQGLNHINE